MNFDFDISRVNCTIKNLSIGTDRSEQTVQTQTREGLHCLRPQLHLEEALSHVKQNCSSS